VRGEAHQDTLASRNNLAYAYQAAGRMGEAIQEYERLLAYGEWVLGTEHSNTDLPRQPSQRLRTRRADGRR